MTGRAPGEIDLILDHGPERFVLHGVYKVEGGRLFLCTGTAAGGAAVNESKRPTEFKAGPGVSLSVLKRQGK